MLTRFATSLLALAAGMIAHNALAADARFAKDLKPAPDSVLGDMRGGFVTVGGVTLDIGITTATYINGKLALATTVSTGPTGPTAPTSPTAPTVKVTAPSTPQISTPQISTPQITTPGSGSGAPGPTTASTIQGSAPQTQGPVTNSSPGSGVPGSIGSLAGAGTVTTNGTVTTTTNDGQTTVIQNPSQVVNAVVNAANDQNIRLDTQVNVVLPGFDATQRSALLTSMGMKMGADGAFGIVSSLPH